LKEIISKQEKEHNSLKNNIYKDIRITKEKIEEEYKEKMSKENEKNKKKK